MCIYKTTASFNVILRATHPKNESKLITSGNLISGNPYHRRGGDHFQTINNLILRTGDGSNLILLSTGDGRNPILLSTGDGRNPILLRTGDGRNPILLRTGDGRNRIDVDDCCI